MYSRSSFDPMNRPINSKVNMQVPHRKLLKYRSILYIVLLLILLHIILRSNNSFQRSVRDPTECTVTRNVQFMKKTVILNQDPVCEWLEGLSYECQFQFWNFGQKFARLSNVVIDSRLSEGKKGGESVNDVLCQTEEKEYLHLKKGYFKLDCISPPSVGFSKDDHLTIWNDNVVCDPRIKSEYRVMGLTIAVQRYEYANLYHTMTDFYNAFLVMLMLNQNPDNVTILWMDAHPQGGLDQTWGVLFGNILRAGSLQKTTEFEDMVWSIMGYNSPLHQHFRPFIPYLEEFREFFLSRHGVSAKKKLNCDKLNILFIWRRDYVAHPRNPKGHVNRKIANEDEIIANVKAILPVHIITDVQLDALPMRKQLELIANTDVLLGMHGAGLSHTLFLPNHAGLIEFYPIYFSNWNIHFKAMASWRRLTYRTWRNYNIFNENWSHFTYIPIGTVTHMLLDVLDTICPPSA